MHLKFLILVLVYIGLLPRAAEARIMFSRRITTSTIKIQKKNYTQKKNFKCICYEYIYICHKYIYICSKYILKMIFRKYIYICDKYIYIRDKYIYIRDKYIYIFVTNIYIFVTNSWSQIFFFSV